jgi:D-alanyl-lipoteichoic acid acyltransferase DltB (MBOAT superfamily)
MQFNSLAFFGFFGIFYVIYLVLQRRLWLQNLWLLLASYVFYGLFSWRFLPVLIFITLSDFCLGILLGRFDTPATGKRAIRKILISISLMIDLGLLAFFKYNNFFIDDFTRALSSIGIGVDLVTLNIFLPIGISFYALKSLSYTLDVYRGRQIPSNNLLEYGIFIAFFPALLAGPIDRPGKLLPQIHQPRRINPNQFAAGFSLILWGYFKKLVIADNMAIIANQIFQVGNDAHGLDILIGILAFTIQIYGDFSGYSDIARGFARLMGFELMINFILPYFALNPADFWQRWHISLSEWLRDYIFFPMRRMVLTWQIKNTMLWALLLPPLVTMLVSGLWHGTGWNFILWGLYHGLLLIIYRVLANLTIPKNLAKFGSSRLGVLMRMGIMFSLVSLGWLFFRADTVGQAFQLISKISLIPSSQSVQLINDLLFFSIPLLLVQIWQAVKGDLLVLTKLRFPVQLLVNSLILVWIVVFGNHQFTEFIYTQF